MATTNADYQPIREPSFQFLECSNEDDIIKVRGYQKCVKKSILFNIIAIIFIFIPYMIISWYPKYNVRCRYKKCALKTAKIVLVTDNHENANIIKVHKENVNIPKLQLSEICYFIYQHNKYVWLHQSSCFCSIDSLLPLPTLEEILDDSKGLTEIEQAEMIKLYGENRITIEVKSYWRLFVEEVFNPFYVFQTVSVIIWSVDDYYVYAICVFLLSIVSIITSLVQTRKQSLALHDLVESSVTGSCQVYRPRLAEIDGKQLYSIDPSSLVPGDLLFIPANGCLMPCDAILLSGNCIVNESMLTGESVPVTKTPPNASDERYDNNVHKRHTLFAGTNVIQTRFYGGELVLARVVSTGFNTSKGSLIRSILYPTPVGIQFYKDSLKFIAVLFCVAFVGMAFCIYIYVKRHAPIKNMVLRSLDIITIIVPPALPAAMTVGMVYSQNRLKKLGIFCISPPRINVCGKIKLACFDKTGTLTHDDLDLYAIMPSGNGSFSDPVQDPTSINCKSHLIQAMATCHSLTRIDGVLTGDPLDLNMFDSISWNLEEPGRETTCYDMLAPTVVKPTSEQLEKINSDKNVPYEIGILRQFPFSSTLQCMSIISRSLDVQHHVVYTKGAPEKILNLCVSSSIPADYNTKLSNYAANGYRIIAVAYKDMPSKFKWKDVQKVKREVIECDLEFLGLIIMQNTLKPETTPVIQSLHAANIRTVMITGDNIMTAVSVARDCGMVKPYETIIRIAVDRNERIYLEMVGAGAKQPTNVIDIEKSMNRYHFAMDGHAWSALKSQYAELIPKILIHGTIFARFQPDQKSQVVNQLQKLDYVVAMCGDGANDCGALKAAHVGISLSQAEASVAAPFTSSIQDISCVLHLMLEGRCALVTSFAVFKYMALYSVIQFFTVLILYTCHSILSNMQFLYVDLIITTSLAVTIGRQGPAKQLAVKRPMGSLVSLANLIPMILQVLLCGLTQLAALEYLKREKWFSPLPPGKEEENLCWENTVIFTVSCFQYLILAFVYSKGRPYRQMFITNGWLIVTIVTLTYCTTLLLVYPFEQLANIFEIIPRGHSHEQNLFRYKLLAIPCIHLLIAIFIETFIADCLWLKKIIHFVTRKKQPKNKYKLLAQDNDYQSLPFNFNTPND